MADYPGDNPQPNDIPVHAVNSPADPCFWEGTLYFGASEYLFMYLAWTSEIQILRVTPDYYTIFQSTLDPCELGPFTNLSVDPDGNPIGGDAHALDFPLSIIILLTETYNLQPDQEALYDVIDSSIPDHKCVRLTGRTSPGSVLVLVDTGAIP